MWRRLGLRALAPAIFAGIVTVSLATARVSWTLAASGVLCWSFVAVLQLLIASAVIRPWTPEVDAPRAFALYVLGHAAWSLWMLATAAFLFLVPGVGLDAMLPTAVLPAAWTAVLVYGFCREVLRLDARRAAWRAALHQALTTFAIVAYIAWAIQLWPRILSL